MKRPGIVVDVEYVDDDCTDGRDKDRTAAVPRRGWEVRTHRFRGSTQKQTVHVHTDNIVRDAVFLALEQRTRRKRDRAAVKAANPAYLMKTVNVNGVRDPV